jgi:hypothetical protein
VGWFNMCYAHGGCNAGQCCCRVAH